jgi:glycosyltransferase involved in cell wall biosynthesis
MSRGGVAETVIDGETGLLFDEQTPECVAETVRSFCDLPRGFLDPDHVRANAERFGVERFRREFSQLVNSALQKRTRSTAAASTSVSASLPTWHSAQVSPIHE